MTKSAGSKKINWLKWAGIIVAIGIPMFQATLSYAILSADVKRHDTDISDLKLRMRTSEKESGAVREILNILREKL